MNRFVWTAALVLVFGLGVGGAYAAGQVTGRAEAANRPATTGATSSVAVQGAGGAAASGQAATGAGGVNARQQQQGSGDPTGQPATQGGRAVTGVVQSVQGGQIVVTTPQGSATLTLPADATVQQLTPATVADIKAGERVLIQTRPGTEGANAVASIQILSGEALGGQLRPGGAGAPGQRGNQ